MKNTLLAIALLTLASSSYADVCDVNNDEVVDKRDISFISKSRGQYVTLPDPRDFNQDGVINVNDARGCVLLCTFPSCAVY
ncbi:MAG: hypothetical protein H6935_15160 [Thiobacillus sp.]|nr:hypothetical protein [Thiobacillus sp.]